MNCWGLLGRLKGLAEVVGLLWDWLAVGFGVGCLDVGLV